MSKSINDLIIEDQEAQEQEDQSQDELQTILEPKPIYGTVDVIFREKIYLKYFWKILLLIGGFYLLPSVQFVAFQTQDENIHCYYNYKCKKDLGAIPAFNNIISNLLYILAGLGIFLIVRFTAPVENEDYGLHGDVSLYYSLAIVLCFEGLFSALYHVCPSRLNFQFDTTFMMIGVALLFVTMFQKRHGARTIGAPRFYAFLAFLTFANSLTLLTGTISIFVWIMVFGGLIYVLIAGSVHIYYHKKYVIDKTLPKRILQKFKDLFTWNIADKPRFIVLVIGNVTTLVVAIVGATRVTQFADYILSVFMVNVLLYVFYYLVMKIRYHEPLSKWVYVLFLLTVGFLGASLHFFNIAVTDKLLTPEESMELNQPCVLFGYFDTHDVWHFLSAIGIFILMVLIYIIDNGLEVYRRSEIKAF